MTVLIGMFLLGLFIALGSWAQDFGDNQKEKLLVKVYFCTETRAPRRRRQAQINAVRAQARRRSARQERRLRLEGRGARADAQAAARDRREPARRTRSRTRSRSRRTTARDVKAISRNLRTPTLPPGVEKIRDGEEVSDRVVKVATRALDRVRDRDDRAPDLVGAPDREHDPALDLLAAAGDRGDEARRRDELVRARPVHARGADLRRARLADRGPPAADRQGGRARADHRPASTPAPASRPGRSRRSR